MGLFVKGDKEGVGWELRGWGRRRQAWKRGEWTASRAVLKVPLSCPPQLSPGSQCPGLADYLALHSYHGLSKCSVSVYRP